MEVKELKAYKEQDSADISRLGMQHILNHEVKWINERMTREEAIDKLEQTKRYHKYLSDDEIAAVVLAIKTLEQEPCDDAVSRQAVEEITWEESTFTDALNVLAEVRDKVRALPSVTPQQKVGKWIEKSGYDGDIYYDCSSCGESWASIEGTPKTNGMNYCPNCGAKMEVQE